MDIIFYHPTFDTQWWIEALHKAIPQARVRAWKSGDNESADYALVWHPPVEMLAGRDLKAVFALGAGVDSILTITASSKIVRIGNRCLNIIGKILPSAFWAQAYWAVKLHRVCKPGASRCVAGVEPVNRGLACKVLPDGKNFLHF